MKGFKPNEESKEATEIIELASEQIETLASAFELIASMLGEAEEPVSAAELAQREAASATIH